MSCAVPYTQLCHAHRCATRGGVPHLHAFSPPMMPCEANCLHSYQLPSCLACWLLHAHCVLPFQRCPTSDLSYDLSAPQLPAVWAKEVASLASLLRGCSAVSWHAGKAHAAGFTASTNHTDPMANGIWPVLPPALASGFTKVSLAMMFTLSNESWRTSQPKSKGLTACVTRIKQCNSAKTIRW